MFQIGFINERAEIEMYERVCHVVDTIWKTFQRIKMALIGGKGWAGAGDMNVYDKLVIIN